MAWGREGECLGQGLPPSHCQLLVLEGEQCGGEHQGRGQHLPGPSSAVGLQVGLVPSPASVSSSHQMGNLGPEIPEAASHSDSAGW